MIDGWRDTKARDHKAHKSKTGSRTRERRKRGGFGKNGVRTGGGVAPAQIALSLGRVLNHLQVVGYRDHRKEDQEKHRQCRYLRPSARVVAAGVAQPQKQHSSGEQNPSEIEGNLHS